MIKPVKHPPARSKSLNVLGNRVRYIEDSEHENHHGKIVLPSRNYKCGGQEARDFLFAITQGIQRYVQRREGLRGKRTERSWGEYVYSSEEGTVPKADGTAMEPCLSAEERDAVEQALLAGPFGRSPCRTAWHIDVQSGRCDCHFLVGAHDDRGVIWANDGFGKGKKNLKLELERIEEAIVARLNLRRRPPGRQLRTPREAHIRSRKKAGKKTLAQKLAALGWNGQPDKLAPLVEKLGYQVIKQTAKTITVDAAAQKPDGKRKRRRYTISTLGGNGGGGTKGGAPSTMSGGGKPRDQELHIIGPDM